MTLGSLFDGSGGFPLAGLMHGITPLWSSEIEEFPLLVTAKRFPDVKQLGDVCKINGSEIEPVDIITFGSPCQDLSVAGKQLGIHKGERSNLFFEAVRIIKEMREATNDRYPRYAVWENVPGAFSSNGGKTSRQSSKPSQASVRTDYLFLDLRDGTVPDAWSVMDGALLGGSTMLNTGESPSDVRESTLSQILELNAPEKYCLSAKACQGILNRAERRGKVLPPMLKEALVEVVGLSKNAPENPEEEKDSSPRERAFTISTNVDQSVCYPINTMVATRHNVDDGRTTFGVGEDGDPQFTLQAAHEHAVCYAIEGNTIDRNSHQNGCGYREEISPTLNTQDRHAICYGVDCRNGCLNEEKTITIQAKPNGGVSLNCTPSVLYNADVYPVENHPADSRCELKEAGTPCQTLTSRMGTGGATCH